jgi:class 3 adenylate cyclase
MESVATLESTDRSTKISDLVAYLRANPGARSGPNELADQFGLEKEFVIQVLSGVRFEQPSSRSRPDRRNRVREFKAWFHTYFDENPLAILGATGLLYVSVLFLVGRILTSANQKMLLLGTSAGLFLAFMVGHGAIYFKCGKPALAIKGAGLLLVPLLASGIYSLLTKKDPHQDNRIVFSIFSIVLLSCTYAGTFALVGAWGALYRAKKEDSLASRQKLLQRYFEISERLKHARQDYVTRPPRLALLLRAYRSYLYFWPFAFGFLISLSMVAMGAIYNIDPYTITDSTHIASGYLVMALAMALFSIVLFSAMCFFAGSAKEGLKVAIIFMAASQAAKLIPTSQNKLAEVLSVGSLISFLINIVLNGGVGLVIGGAAKLGERTLREKKIQANDEATLVSELLHLQWRLADKPVRVCVMAVDVVQSTKMKESADPLNAEYAFRRYQEWVAWVSARFNGTVDSTAGDGAIVAFAQASDALTAAQALLKDIPRFNREDNKLVAPFRLRIGIHVGDVIADPKEVQFTRVIDVAAHIEKMAPIGRIAISQDVANALIGADLVDTGNEVDGSRILIVNEVAEVTPELMT